MTLKEGVSIKLLTGCMIPAILCCNDWFRSVNKEFVITSGNDGKHLPNSKHYSGEAFDLRTRHLTEAQTLECRDYLRSKLDNQFDIIIESDHIHIEYDENL
jgi:hypothetical protein